MDFWAGRYWRMSENFSGDLRLSQYTYPDDPRRVSYNRTELTATLGFRNRCISRLSIRPTPRPSAPLRVTRKATPGRWSSPAAIRSTSAYSISAGLGHYGLDEIYHDSYNYWNARSSATLKPFELQLAYLGVDDKRRGTLRRRFGGRPGRVDRVMALFVRQLSPGNRVGGPAVLMGNRSGKVGCRGTKKR